MARTAAELKTIAAKVTDALYADLHAGKLPAIGIDQVRAELQRLDSMLTPRDRERLEEMTCREVVERASR